MIMNGNLDILNTLLSIDLVRRAIRRYFNYRGYNPETLEYIKRMVTPRRLLNFISYLFAHRFGIFIFEHQPPAVEIEIVRGCNFRCLMCHAWNFKVKYLSFDQVKQILKYFTDSLIFRPFGIGEPFLNKDIYKITSFASFNLNFLVEIASNFSVIDVQKALDMGAYEIRASIDSINKDKFYKIRGGNFDRVKRNLQEILEAKRKRGKKYPIISISTVISDLNLDEICDILDFGISLGIRKFHLLPVMEGKLLSGLGGLSLEDILKLNVKVRDKLKRYKGLRIKFLSLRGDILGYEPGGYCNMAFFPIVDFEGNIYPCCKVLGEKSASFGNIFSEPKKALKNRNMFLRKFRTSPPEFCKSCDLYYRKTNVSFYKNRLEKLIYYKIF